MSVVGPALEASKFYYEEEEIRDMFEKLIVNSLDNRQAANIHPSFTEIIKQLSPLDAQNLKCFNGQKSLPICEYRIQQGHNQGYKTILTNVFIDNPECTDLHQQSISMSSLNRLELINIDYLSYLTDQTKYLNFEETDFYKKIKDGFSYLLNDSDGKIEIQKGQASITPLGSAFLQICLNPLPKKSDSQSD